MDGSRRPWRRLSARLAGGLVAPGLFILAAQVRADQPALPSAVQAHTAPASEIRSAPLAVVAPLDLAACRALALEKQPGIAAARSTLAAAITRQQALEKLCVPTFLARDLPTRRKNRRAWVITAAHDDRDLGRDRHHLRGPVRLDQLSLRKDSRGSRPTTS